MILQKVFTGVFCKFQPKYLMILLRFLMAEISTSYYTTLIDKILKVILQ